MFSLIWELNKTPPLFTVSAKKCFEMFFWFSRSCGLEFFYYVCSILKYDKNLEVFETLNVHGTHFALGLKVDGHPDFWNLTSLVKLLPLGRAESLPSGERILSGLSEDFLYGGLLEN